MRNQGSCLFRSTAAEGRTGRAETAAAAIGGGVAVTGSGCGGAKTSAVHSQSFDQLCITAWMPMCWGRAGASGAHSMRSWHGVEVA